jgi:hypothetical protein
LHNDPTNLNSDLSEYKHPQLISLLHDYLLETDELMGIKQEQQFMQFLESIGAKIDQPNQHPAIINGDNG